MTALVELAYLLAAVFFIIGLKRLASPATARNGNTLASLGMLIAVVVTLLDQRIVGFTGILIGLVAGAGVGAVLARTIKMTAMPQMVALLNGFGGAASVLVASAEFLRVTGEGGAPIDVGVSVQFSILVGAVTFSGSLIAFGKLQELVSGQPVTYPLQKPLNALLLLAILATAAYLLVGDPGFLGLGGVFGDNVLTPLIVMVSLSLILGVLSVIPIGGADMPVVISLLNSYSGIAAASTGFVIDNDGLIISGALVGASGIILTQIMCKAMNRSLGNVLFGAFGATSSGSGGPAVAEGGTVRQVSAEDAAIILAYAQEAVIVPGYGLAVSQAQHAVRELANILEGRGVNVRYAIHPVAGRMPGHMNVLLAEADVPYDQLWEMERINPEFERIDVVLVIGANDVVNPAARNNTSSPIYGMPILDVDKAHQVIVLKRSMNFGFAGIDNELFYRPNTSMLFGDAKASLNKLIAEVKEA
jgi:proton-translocating NAD(P)+ transhydrogenase subunit beta